MNHRLQTVYNIIRLLEHKQKHIPVHPFDKKKPEITPEIKYPYGQK